MAKQAQTPKEIRKLIRADAKWAKYTKVIEHNKTHVNFDNFISELESMHSSRKSRTLYATKEYSVKKLIECVVQDAAYRSRCVEIMMLVNKEFRKINLATDLLRPYILARYKKEISALYTTKIDRETFVKAMLSDSAELLSDFEKILEIAKFVIEDIDKFGWSVKHIIEGLTILYKKDHAS